MAADTAVIPQLTHHFEEVRETAAAPDALFARLDDPASLASHMTGSSWMMGGGRMAFLLDEQHGKAIGSHIIMTGSAFGLSLRVDEVVVEHEPPHRKRWRTVGAQQLLIIGGYEMGFEIEPLPSGSRLRVWIDYALPGSFPGRLLGTLFAGFYARWCVDRMVGDAARTFDLAAGEKGSV